MVSSVKSLKVSSVLLHSRQPTLLVGDTITEDTNAFSENAISKKNMAKTVRTLNFLIFRNTKNTVSKNALVSST